MKMTTRIRVLAPLLCALSAAGCGPKKKSAIVLWVATDMPRSALATVRVTAIGQGGATPMPYYENREFRVGATGSNELPLPGSLALTKDPSDQSVTAEVVVDVSPTMGNGTPFQVKAKARFVANEWRQLELFLPYQCTDENVRRLCSERSTREGVEYTCGALGPDPCILVERSQLNVFEQDAGAPSSLDVQQITTLDASMDAAVDSAVDARSDTSADTGIDSAMDAPTDTRVDSGVDTGVDVPPVVGPALPALTPAYPNSGARYSGGRPTLVARLPSDCMGANRLELVLCPTRTPAGETCARQVVIEDPAFVGCSGSLHTMQVPSANALGPGSWSWAMRLRTVTPTLLRSSPLVWRRMSVAAAAGSATSILGAVPDLDDDGLGDVITTSQSNAPALYAPFSRLATMPALRAFEGYPSAGMGLYGSFGYRVLVLGDAEGDGTIDTLFIDPDVVAITSRMYRYTFGAGGFAVSSVQPSFDSPAPGVYFGEGAASADFNRDGLPDVLLGPLDSSVNQARVYYGQRTGGYNTMMSTVLSPITAIGAFGRTIAAGCDLDGDGYQDAVIAGGPDFMDRSVSVFYGGPTGLPATATYEIPHATLAASVNEAAGEAIACNGDYNGDGYADIAIGAFHSEANPPGGFVIYAGGPTRARGTALYSSMGSTPNTGYGSVLTFVGDQDGQPGDELFLGEPTHSMSVGFGKLLAYRTGTDVTASVTSPFVPSLTRFGAAVVFLGPIGPAGEDGFAVGAPDGATDSIGAIQVYHRASPAMMVPSVTAFLSPTASGTTMPRGYGRNFAQ
ncbi:MAG: VCBS repeat-containing protein [Myxococcales bacterium]|nr:VCBS repeat-containing protein [Myxococcales bacterium]